MTLFQHSKKYSSLLATFAVVVVATGAFVPSITHAAEGKGLLKRASEVFTIIAPPQTTRSETTRSETQTASHSDTASPNETATSQPSPVVAPVAPEPAKPEPTTVPDVVEATPTETAAADTATPKLAMASVQPMIFNALSAIGGARFLQKRATFLASEPTGVYATNALGNKRTFALLGLSGVMASLGGVLYLFGRPRTRMYGSSAFGARPPATA